MKRRIHATVTLEYLVDLYIDPDGEMSDADAAALAISSAFGAQKHEVQVFGPNIKPAVVFREHADVRIDGED